jgi:hypothetical protein
METLKTFAEAQLPIKAARAPNDPSDPSDPPPSLKG